MRRPMGVSKFRLCESTMETRAGLHPQRLARALTPVTTVLVSRLIIFPVVLFPK
jgi:hypothetical protein